MRAHNRRFQGSPCQPEPDTFCINLPRCTKERLACKAFSSFVSNESGGRWKDMPRRNPTTLIYEDVHAESEPQRQVEDPRARRARAGALSKLIPLRQGERRFATLAEIGAAVGVDGIRVSYWKTSYPSCAHIIKKLLAPPSE